MRSVLLVGLLVVPLAAIAGCASDTLENTTYRRVVDTFDSYDQCVAQPTITPCYQTLTFCADGRANANLEFRQEGAYIVRENEAVASLQTATVHFDLDKLSARELPGRHPWELVEPVYYDCAQ